MPQKSILFLAVGAALCGSVLFASVAQAQEAQLQPTIEVTASRVAQTVDASLASVSIITRADIEKTNAPDLIEVLRLQAGVDVARLGGAGTQTSVFLRGTNSNHVLVLVDGVRVASANTGAFAFENLPLDAVERIEIVRGPRASYWGSDAVGGVIQIFTRRLDGAHLAASAGSYGSADGSVGYGMQTDTWGVSAQAGGRHVDGFSASNALSGPYVYNPDDNPMQNHNQVAQAWTRLGTQTLSASALRSVGTQSFDNGDFGPGISHTLDQAIGMNLEGAIRSDWQHRLSIGTTRTNIDTPAFGSAYRSTREQLSWTNDVAIAANQHLIAGIDYVHDRGRSLDAYAGTQYDKTRDNTGVFAGWRAQADALDGEVSGRYDHNSDFGGEFSGSIAGGYQLTDGLRFVASYGTAFSAPTLSQLYSPGYGGYYAGNPLLDPERSRTGEVGLEWKIDSANRLDARAFTTRVRDLIDFSGGAMFQAININHAAIDGLELTHSLHAGAYSWTNTLTLQDPRNEDTDTQLLRRPRRKFSSVFDAQLNDAVSAGAEVVYAGRANDFGGKLGAYAIVNLRASYVINPQWRLGARLENLGDRSYQLAYGYNTPGRSGYLTVSWSPGK
ncbi:TonB-dependent receptor domain-containing protein [Rudaea sp.]|uniref:TonB-dependent receptor domain-containing protein n=1 Tax=Rudaea sp. TaxID=2136325 RepID=UPI0037852817